MVFDTQVTVNACKVLVAERMVNCMKFTEKFPWFSFVNFLLGGEKLFFGCFVPYIRLPCTLIPLKAHKNFLLHLRNFKDSLSLSLSLSPLAHWAGSGCLLAQDEADLVVDGFCSYQSIHDIFMIQWTSLIDWQSSLCTKGGILKKITTAILLCLVLSMENLFI